MYFKSIYVNFFFFATRPAEQANLLAPTKPQKKVLTGNEIMDKILISIKYAQAHTHTHARAHVQWDRLPVLYNFYRLFYNSQQNCKAP